MSSITASVTTDTLTHYPHVPQYYILSSALTVDQEDSVHTVLRITPIYFGIITTLADANLALKFSTVVLQVADITAARLLAQQLYDTPDHSARSIIIGTANILTGVYQDHEANIPC